MSVPAEFKAMSTALGANNIDSAALTLQKISGLGMPGELFDSFCAQLIARLAGSDNSDQALVNIERFLAASRSPLSWLALFEREPQALQTLVQLFCTSQYLADILIADPEAFDLLRMTGGQAIAKNVLLDEVMAEVQATNNLRTVMRILRDYRHRETLRIAYGDFVLQQSLELVTEQLSNLAESILQAAVFAAERDLATRRPAPTQADGRRAAFAVIALGRLGGTELNYSNDIDLLFVYEPLVERRGPGAAVMRDSQVEEYFQRVGHQVIKLVSEPTSRGIAYRVDTRLRPDGAQGPLVVSFQRALNYYDSAGRTWERQAFVKARAVAGNIGLGELLIERLQTWIFRRYLMRTDITGLAALKRRIETRSNLPDQDKLDVKFGHGGINDVECTIQFLQLLYGGDEASVRCTGTLPAIQLLQRAKGLTVDEASRLTDNYSFLRRCEHHLQIMVDRSAQGWPNEPVEFANIAKRLGFRDSESSSSAALLRDKLQEVAQANRSILDHLLHAAFDADVTVAIESDLILDPEPSPAVIQSTLDPFGFTNCDAAYRNLQALAVESIPFLSTRRCRHFLAAIAPKLLAAISRTPNPDATLISLANVTDSLGGKAVLWELFSHNPPTLELCVRLCAGSPYLASLLTTSPGMIDELMDSLMLDSLPTHDELAQTLAELCRGAVDVVPILQSFKSSMHLRVGVREILGKSSIAQTHAFLSDIAEVCLEQVIHYEFHRLVNQLGLPTRIDTGGGQEAAELVVLAVGKLGGREPNYHSDLDVIFLFDVEGLTRSLVPNRRFEPTTNRHFFNQLCQRVIQAVTRVGGAGRLFDLDVRLRPLGRSGELAITIEDLRRYFAGGGGQVWERQTLCKARPIWGSPHVQASVMDVVSQTLAAEPWSSDQTQQILEHRMQLQKGAGPFNLKRGLGGTMDIEFVVQLLQLAHVSNHPHVLVPGTLDALGRLREAKLIDIATAIELQQDYEFLRHIESGIRLMNMSARHDLPSDAEELDKLAFLMCKPRAENGEQPATAPAASLEPMDRASSLEESSPSTRLTGAQLRDKVQTVRRDCRAIFQRIFNQYLPASVPTDEQ